MSAFGNPRPSIQEIREKCQEVFGYKPCLWQCRALEATLKGSDVIIDVGTGAGKTLAFFLPLLFQTSGIQIIVTALNILGQQNVETLQKAKVSAISISAECATPQNFQDILEGRYRVVVVNPEQLMKPNGGFEKLFKNEKFVSRISSIVFDEAHCISQWGTFRPEYKQVSRLRYLLPNTPFVFASATFSPLILEDIKQTLHLRDNNLTHIRLPNDRPNVSMGVRQMKHAVSSFLDLIFLIPQSWKEGDPPPKKFVVFFDSIAESVRAGRFLRRRLPIELRKKIRWLHSNMSEEFKRQTVEQLKKGEIWGICATDSFGMGMDLPDIAVIVNWKILCSMCTLWQRLGRGARDRKLTATAYVFVEKKYFDSEREKAAKRKAAREQTKKRKRTEVRDEEPARKSRRIGDAESATRASVPVEEVVLPEVEEINVVDGLDAITLEELMDWDFDDDESDDEEPEERVPRQREEHVLGVMLDLSMCLEDRLEVRRALYHEQEKGRNSKAMVKKRGVVSLPPELDDFVNADERKLGCRRVPIKAYFGSTRAATTTPSDCDPSTPAGCSRCLLPAPTVCCDIHSPLAFETFAAEKPKPVPKPKRIGKKPYKPTQFDLGLRSALRKWRIDTTSTEYGPAFASDIGGCLVMPNETLNRVVDCAHWSLLTTKEDLRRELRWPYIDKWGESVLSMVRAHASPIPDPAGNGPPRQAAVASNARTPALNNDANPRPIRKINCSQCKQAGHNKRTCPLLQPRPPAAGPSTTSSRPASPNILPPISSTTPSRATLRPPTSISSPFVPPVPALQSSAGAATLPVFAVLSTDGLNVRVSIS